jgi:hypothetical protein
MQLVEEALAKRAIDLRAAKRGQGTHYDEYYKGGACQAQTCHEAYTTSMVPLSVQAGP